MEKIKKLNTTPSRPGAFSGFLKANKNIKKEQAITYLKTSEAYSLHKPKRKKFIRKKSLEGHELSLLTLFFDQL